jgi:integrase
MRNDARESDRVAAAVDIRRDDSVAVRIRWRDAEKSADGRWGFSEKVVRVYDKDGGLFRAKHTAAQRALCNAIREVRSGKHSMSPEELKAWKAERKECPACDKAKRSLRVRDTTSRARFEVEKQIQARGGDSLKHRRKTFNALADAYAAKYLREYVPVADANGNVVRPKRCGLRGGNSLGTALGHLKMLKAYFGDRLVSGITYDDLETFRSDRKATPVTFKNKPPRERTWATVNRELSLLRAIFAWAVRARWINRDPFLDDDSLIDTGLETPRKRVLSREEEERLLAACDAESKRQHLRPIIIAAVETGMRLGEILTLEWSDVALDATPPRITLRADKTKTLKSRTIPVTARLLSVLRELQRSADGRLVFPVRNDNGVMDPKRTSIKTAFNSARKAAGLDGSAPGVPSIRFHDLRHTFGTRADQRGVSAASVKHIAGWAPKSNMHDRYVNADESTLTLFLERIDPERNARENVN